MTEQERDALLLDLRDRLDRIEDTQAGHGKKLDELQLSVDLVDGRVSDLTRAVRELGGNVADDPPEEAIG